MEDIIKRMQTKKELKNIRSKLKKESLLSKNKKDINEFEEFQKSIGDVKEKKYNHGAIRDAYLTKLGWEIKYNALNSKAWLVDKEGNYIDRNGNTTKNKKERREFKTQWEITKETDFIKFLREQTKKRFSEIEYSPEEEVLAKRETNKKEEYSPEELELSDRLAKEKEVKEVEYSPEEEMTAREATEPKEEYVIKNKQKKPSLWKRFTKSIKRLFSKEKNS